MGTFILRPLSVFTINGAWLIRVAGVVNPAPTNPEFVENIFIPDGSPHNYNNIVSPGGDCSLTCTGLSLYLDGSLSPIDTNNLPPGFVITSAHVTCILELTGLGEIRLFKNLVQIASTTTILAVDVDLGAIPNLDLQTATLQVEAAPTTGDARISGLRISGEYTTGSISLNPAAGNVEPGQSITVTSAIDLAAGTFAAIQGDKVIPLVPKITPDGVILEVPTPATDDCFDCMDDCPECSECVDTCSDDLDSVTCQECMENCFDCLVECLESEEFAEACHESTGAPPGEIPIRIVCSFPAEFEGTVPLGDFTILLANASGIYRLVNGKTNDTLYSSSRDGSTYDVKIPNPFGKTGFFRS